MATILKLRIPGSISGRERYLFRQIFVRRSWVFITVGLVPNIVIKSYSLGGGPALGCLLAYMVVFDLCFLQLDATAQASTKFVKANFMTEVRTSFRITIDKQSSKHSQHPLCTPTNTGHLKQKKTWSAQHSEFKQSVQIHVHVCTDPVTISHTTGK